MNRIKVFSNEIQTILKKTVENHPKLPKNRLGLFNPTNRKAQTKCRIAQTKCRIAQTNCRIVQTKCRKAQTNCRKAQTKCRIAQVNRRIAQIKLILTHSIN
jgi:hypothetical protein